MMCPEAEEEVRAFVADVEAALGAGAGAEASAASLLDCARCTSAISERLRTWADADESATASTIAELLSRPAFKRAVLLVINESTRWAWAPVQRSAEEQEALEARVQVLHAAVFLCGYMLTWGHPAPAVLDFARLLVLSQALEALSGRLSDARAELDHLSAQAAAAADGILQTSAHLSKQLIAVVGMAAALTCACIQLAAPPPGALGPPAAGNSNDAAGTAAAASACYAQELAAALRASAVVEHTCAALASGFRLLWASTLAAFTDDTEPSAQREVVDLLTFQADWTMNEVTFMLRFLSRSQAPCPPPVLAGAALLGPCASYTALAHGIAVLSAMDGEGTHGLEPSVAGSVITLVQLEAEDRLSQLSNSSAGERERELSVAVGRRARVNRCEKQLRTLVMCLARQAREGVRREAAAARVLPCHDAALGLVMRAARVGVQTGAEAEAGRTAEEEVAAVMAAYQGTGPYRVLLPEMTAGVLAVDALSAATSLVRVRTGAEAGSNLDLGEEWWRLAAALAPQLQLPDTLFAAHYGANVLAQAPRVARAPAPLPPAPPTGLQSALAGGVLPCLERLFRRSAAGLREGGPGGGYPGALRCHEAEALAAFIKTTPGGWIRLAPLLAWGDAWQAAALVRTIGKGLEAKQRTPTVNGDMDACVAALLWFTSSFLFEGWAWLEGLAAARQGRGAGPGGGGGGAGALSPAEQQLLEMLAAAAAAWLPPLIGDVVGRAMRGIMNEAQLAACLGTLPLLACVDVTSRAPSATLAPAGAGAGGPGGGGTGGAGASSGSGGAGWLAELCPMHLIGMALSARDMMKITGPPHLAEACCTVAAALPEDVMRLNDTDVAWSPQQLRSLGAERRAGGHTAEAEAAEALAAQLTLEALSGRLTDARAELESLADRAAAAADAGAIPQASAGICIQLAGVVGGVGDLTTGCLSLVITEPKVSAQPVAAAASVSAGSSDAAAEAAASLCYTQELAAALRASAVTMKPGASASAAAVKLLPRGAALGLAMRAARVGVQAAAEAGAGRTKAEELAALTAARLGTGPCRVLLTWSGATLLALDALAAVRRLTEGPGISEEWWRLALALAPRQRSPYIGFPAYYGQQFLTELPALPLTPAPLPPAPPAGLESALAGGVLPCLERLFRRTAASLRTGRPGATDEEEALTAFILHGGDDGSWRWLAPLLAWGDTRQAAALLRTIGKGLEATLPASGLDEGSYGNALTSTARRFLRHGRSWLESLVTDGSRSRLGGGGPGTLSPAERQLLEMLAAAAAAWLPPLCRLLTGQIQRSIVHTAFLFCVVSWLPLLACAERAPRAPATAGDATAGQSVGGGGWLAQPIPAELIRASLDVWSQDPIMQLTKGSHLPHLAEACCAVAAALPEEVAGRGGAGLAWDLAKLRSLGAECRARGHAAAAEAAEALAAQLVRWAHGSGPRGGRGGARASAASGAQALAARFGAWFPGLEAAAALLPASPAAARQLLGGCSNPACANLEGDRDAALPLRACAGCGGAASYCSRECQTAHWRLGHREACRGGAGGGSGARRSG
ncbi:hypothetical protein HYH03_018346 [Edaphochlamys debaryana]|uniref:MYND-type domain-containing protein n=1 Tax=Edaphochlamys debaryana TaxID=47281 RepID=A0A835XGQ6_9CHLO|nr:hypothetical protein HYH03_018346 [Edaphochlamys debaryana]|eukprot:KAG2482752.1 hypothetical protein HYH03_018346 [Edaphochlamys debaryana]